MGRQELLCHGPGDRSRSFAFYSNRSVVLKRICKLRNAKRDSMQTVHWLVQNRAGAIGGEGDL
jgi:hypothetical protein